MLAFVSKAQYSLENYEFQPIQHFLHQQSSDSLLLILDWSSELNSENLSIIAGDEAYTRYDDSSFVVLVVADSILGNVEIPLFQSFIGDGGQAYISSYIVKFSQNKYKLLVIEHFTGYRFGDNEDVTLIDRTEFIWLKPKDGKLVTETFWEMEE